MTNEIKVGVIGTGFAQKTQIPGFKNIEGFEVVALAGNSFEKTKDVASKFNIPNVYSTWEELVRDPEIDLVSIVTPPFWHYDMTLTAFTEGKDVLCEKPMAMNIDEAYEMWQLGELGGNVGMINHEFRNLPERAFFRDLVHQGKLGEIYELMLSFDSGGFLPFRDGTWSWWSSNLSGGGIWGALGSHLIDYIRWVFGDISGIYGHLLTNVHHRKDPITSQPRMVTSDDAYHALFTLKRGGNGIMHGSVTRHGKGGGAITAHGSEGGLMMKKDNTIWFASEGEDWTQLEIPTKYHLRPLEEGEDGRVLPFERLLEDLKKGIHSRKSPTPSFEDGYRVQRVMDALKTSHNEKTWIEIR
ncbi:MAG: Gfo/Idh/MocA family protein [Candidatus Kariarchaeaceae archaeon]